MALSDFEYAMELQLRSVAADARRRAETPGGDATLWPNIREAEAILEHRRAVMGSRIEAMRTLIKKMKPRTVHAGF